MGGWFCMSGGPILILNDRQKTAGPVASIEKILISKWF
jgi:hypothetical protein